MRTVHLAVVALLVAVDPSRITAISNGEEKPRATGHDEDSWRENRRDDLLPGGHTGGPSM